MFNKEIAQMDFKELRNAVQILYDAYEKMRRNYEDAISNIDSSNFSDVFTKEYGDMKSQITVSAEKISTMVTKSYLDDTLEGYSTYDQTAMAIRTAVCKGVDFENAIEVDSEAEFTDKTQIYLLGGEYYYYNEISEEWENIDDSIYSVFNQTAYGFQLKGDVSIDGNVIVNADIKGSSFSDSENKSTLTLSSDTGYADLTFTSYSTANYDKALFKIYEGAGSATLFLFGQEVCTANSDGITFPDISSGSVVAVFG